VTKTYPGDHAKAGELYALRDKAGLTRTQVAQECGMSLYRLDHPKTDEDVASIRAALAKLVKKAAAAKTLAPHKPPAPRAADGGGAKARHEADRQEDDDQAASR
jgi:hypothetical protein